jgi:hypothetical protein
LSGAYYRTQNGLTHEEGEAMDRSDPADDDRQADEWRLRIYYIYFLEEN